MRLDNICKEYERSEITVVFLHDKKSGKYFNIFSIAEMCPIEQEKSDEIKYKEHHCKKIAINRNKDIYISRFFSDNPKDSLDFYRGRGNIRTVDIEGEINIESVSNILVQEPECEIPLLIESNPYKEYDILNILPNKKLPVYLCSLIDIESKTKKLFTNEEIIKINEFIIEVLGIDLCKYNEYFGAILLCMPNNILRKIEISIGKSEKNVLVSFYERDGKSILNGRIELIDERVNGIVRLSNNKIDSIRMLIDIPYVPNKLRVRVFDDNDNLIYEALSSFIKSISMNIGIKEPTRIFSITDKNGEKSNIHVNTLDYSNKFNIGKKNEYGVNDRFIETKEERQLDKLEEDRAFIYFPGRSENSKTKAKQIVRELISKARKECIICDPYLSAEDVLDFGVRVEAQGVKIKLLSSSNFLTRKVSGNELITKGEELYNIINQLNNKNKSNKIECNVLKGRQKSPLHDRFIVIDKNVYILGSSLNEFGSRATTLFKVPNPKILKEEAKLWFEDKDKSISIDEWITNRGN